jgi:AcrR family transcriptional regulator
MSRSAPSDAATDEAHLSTGRGVFAQKGYSGTSVREIKGVADLSIT